MKTLLLLLCATLTLLSPARAADGAPTMTAAEFAAKLNFQQGEITLPGKIATLALPPSFRYLAPADAERVLVEGWGNPPGGKTLGMIVPADVNPVTEGGWGVIVHFEKDGHVKDDDADTIKYDELLKEMQQAVTDGNAERTKAGYDPLTLVGWAEAPSYDKGSHKLYWAKELRSPRGSSLNYSVRVLGREGVLVLNAIGSMDQIALMKTEMRKVTAFTEFTSGNRYADFDGKTDKVAEYGIAALVAGGVAAKLGLFGKLLALLLVLKKFIIIGVGLVGTWLYKLFKGRKQDDTDSPSAFTPEPAEAPAGEKKVDLDKH